MHNIQLTYTLRLFTGEFGSGAVGAGEGEEHCSKPLDGACVEMPTRPVHTKPKCTSAQQPRECVEARWAATIYAYWGEGRSRLDGM